MALIETRVVPEVPIDYTALLCRRPNESVRIPAPPTRLSFLEQILRANAATKENDARNEAAPTEDMGASQSALPEELVPPENFAMVNSWIYRSSFPKKKHFPFLKTLGLRSVLTLILEDYPEQNINFLDENGIRFFQYGIPGNKEPFVQIPDKTITAALVTLLDRRNYPILIHCNKGKHLVADDHL
ncbi:hypothetical protein MVES_001628 [Malassezia vespertilionis]|uniref:Uncharacterized protein n=1 Tax=Malassezia vespertilionis TaxID=2020962 RepID=A0A2N1JCQ5_9BASI|nr:hypothetical protein MVES_001628 [Malassezia vespertilionis]